MDFNDLQSTWKNENTENVKLPNHLEKINSANMPLEIIKKNLKNEFVYQIYSIIFLGLIPFILSFPTKGMAIFYLMFSLFVGVCIYYLVKLYRFYLRLGKTTLNTKDSLYETYFEIRLNMELYKTFGFALVPFLILFLFGIFYYETPEFFNKGLNSTPFLVTTFSIVVFSILYMGFALEWWVHHFYGKYAKEIRKVIDELKEE
jgi:membrane-bound ClpP family serine protease